MRSAECRKEEEIVMYVPGENSGRMKIEAYFYASAAEMFEQRKTRLKKSAHQKLKKSVDEDWVNLTYGEAPPFLVLEVAVYGRKGASFINGVKDALGMCPAFDDMRQRAAYAIPADGAGKAAARRLEKCRENMSSDVLMTLALSYSEAYYYCASSKGKATLEAFNNEARHALIDLDARINWQASGAVKELDESLQKSMTHLPQFKKS